MKRKLTALALPILLAATFALPAQARDNSDHRARGNFVIEFSTHGDKGFRARIDRQRPHYKQKKRLNPRQIARILHDRGFYNLRRMRTDGRVYKLKANGRRGNLVRLTVSARNGKILDRQIIRRYRPVDRWQYRNWDQGHSAWRQSEFRQPFWMR